MTPILDKIRKGENKMIYVLAALTMALFFLDGIQIGYGMKKDPYKAVLERNGALLYAKKYEDIEKFGLESGDMVHMGGVWEGKAGLQVNSDHVEFYPDMNAAK